MKENLTYHILDMFVVQHFHLDADVRTQFGEPGPRVLSTAQDQAILVVPRLHSVQRLLQRGVTVLLVIPLLHLRSTPDNTIS